MVVEKSPFLWLKVEKNLELFDTLDQERNNVNIFPNLFFIVQFCFLYWICERKPFCLFSQVE